MSLHADFLSRLTPGTIVMHSTMLNELHPLIKIRHKRIGNSEPVFDGYYWNGAPVMVSDALPERGWFVVPGAPE